MLTVSAEEASHICGERLSTYCKCCSAGPQLLSISSSDLGVVLQSTSKIIYLAAWSAR
jgi:hypothetical protein